MNADTQTDHASSGTYHDPCPKCGARLIGFTKEDFIEHLRENGEDLAAKIHEEMVIDEVCVDAKPEDTGGDCADATGAQRGHCPGCNERTKHYVEANAGVNGTVSRKECAECGHEWVERYMDAETERRDQR